jgi:hypothetical protein
VALDAPAEELDALADIARTSGPGRSLRFDDGSSTNGPPSSQEPSTARRKRFAPPPLARELCCRQLHLESLSRFRDDWFDELRG